MASSPRWTTGGAPLRPGLLPPCGEPVVCVPARSEARRLPALLAALDRQRDLTKPLRVVLLLNNCANRSLEVAERAASTAERCEVRILERHLPPGLAHAGSARRAAMAAGAVWLEADGAFDGALLTKDADATPAEDWVVRSLAALDAGADFAAAALNGDAREEARFSPALRQAIDEVLAAQALAVRLEDAVDPTPGDARRGTPTAPEVASPFGSRHTAPWAAVRRCASVRTSRWPMRSAGSAACSAVTPVFA